MTVADYVLAVLCLLGCGAWAAVSFLVASIDAFVPTPDADSAKIGKTGCASLIAAIAAAVWFGGVIWNGSWSWLS